MKRIPASFALILAAGLNATPGSLTLEQLENAAYLPVTPYNPPLVALKNGVFHGRWPGSPLTYELRLERQHVVFGDLDRDGAPDAAAILYETYGSSGPHTVLAALVNRQGKPVFADAVDLGYRFRLTSLQLEGNAIVATGIPEDTGAPERAKYVLQTDGLAGVRDESVMIPSHGRSVLFSALAPFLSFQIPDNFEVKPDCMDALSNGKLDFAKVSYPNAGSMDFLCLGNYRFSKPGDPDKIIRERTGGAIEICISGSNYPWRQYYYRNNYEPLSASSGAVLYESKVDPAHVNWRGLDLAIPIKPSTENGRTQIIFITVRSGDRNSAREVLRTFTNIRQSILRSR